ncbi:hypothetical protein ACIRVF_15545 [Kitasatospora sp. NPDC101157]|uniref:hypothetical protein n=1 Tax=Kitasatospora sp. NPDC101157 TaxID=3364098 RepID=UPI00380A3720
MTYRIVAVEGVDGSGKSTLLNGLEKALSADRKVIRSRPSRAMVHAFRRIVETGRPGVLYQDVLPDDFRHTAYVLEAAVQFRYEQPRYEAADLVLFDRWRQTWEVYCAEIVEHRSWLDRITAGLPEPDTLFWVRVDPELAYRRLVARHDRWVDVYSPDRLRAKVERLCARYEEAMRDRGAVELDGAASADEVLARALEALGAAGAASVGQ